MRTFITNLSVLGGLGLGLLAVAAPIGCDLQSDDAAAEHERKPIGKADAQAGSCEARCDTDFDAAEDCQCDASCAQFGDCCDDYESLCTTQCDPTLLCGAAQTCVDGQLYPTTCGAKNCDEPIGACDGGGDTNDGGGDTSGGDEGGDTECDPTLLCGAAQTCVDGQLYPTTCGAKNCDDPLGPCDGGGDDEGGETQCDPTLLCGAAQTCVDGALYPTTCGAKNCDDPVGPC